MKEIAEERNLKPSTIFGHLAGFIPTGEVEVHDLVPDAHLTLVHETVSKHGWPEETEKYNYFMQHIQNRMLYREYDLILKLLNENS